MSNEGHGFMNPVGGLPTWCGGGRGDLGTKEASGVTEIIVASYLRGAMCFRERRQGLDAELTKVTSLP